MNLIFYKIGFLGPILLFFITTYLLWNHPYLYVYILFFFINVLFNKLLKHVFQQQRPSGSKTIMNENTDLYGMPSGHAQSVFFSTSFLYFVNGPLLFIFIELCIAMLTVYQRWKYKQHTIAQLGVGSLLGILFAFYVVTFT